MTSWKEWRRIIVWPAVAATILCAVSVISGLLGAPANIWIPTGMAGIAAAMLAASR